MSELQDIPDFPGYSVSQAGVVWSTLGSGGCCPTLGVPHQLKPAIDTKGYLFVNIFRSGRGHLRRVHTLVLTAYVGPRPTGQECRHLDGNRLNNNLENLAWGTRARNAKDRQEHGTGIRGVLNPFAKLTNEQIQQIHKLRAQGELQKTIAAHFGVTQQTISRVVIGQIWKHVS